MRLIRPIATALAELSVPVEPILQQAGLSRAVLDDEQARVPTATELAFWRAAEALSGDPALGLRVSERLSLGALGGVGYLLYNSETLEQLLARAQRFSRLVDDAAKIWVEREGELAHIRFARPGQGPLPAAGVECLFAAALTTARKLWPAARAHAVSFVHAPRADQSMYRERLHCDDVRFLAEVDGITCAASLLTSPVADADPELGRVLESHNEHLLAQLPTQQTFAGSVRRQLEEALTRGLADVETLARAMGVSERTLRRRLMQEGTSYQALLDGLRHDLALSLVAHSDLALAQVAERLGFAETSAFYKAFKRWTDTTPALYRAQARGATEADD